MKHWLNRSGHALAALSFMLLLAATLAGCDRQAAQPINAIAQAPAPAPASAVRAFVTILPEVYFVHRVGGARVAVESLVKPGQAAETYQPTPRQLAGLQRANLYFALGVPFEDVWLDRIGQANPRMSIVNLSEGLPRRAIEAHVDDDETTGTAAPAGPDAHEGRADPHLWMDPVLVSRMAERIAQALSEKDPAGKTEYDQNLKAFQSDLAGLDQSIRQQLAGLKSRKFMIYHPALGYFADRYGLTQEPIQIAGKDPSARTLAAIVHQAQAAGIRVIFVQRQFSPRSAETVAATLRGRVEPVDDLAENYLENLRRIAGAIASAGN